MAQGLRREEEVRVGPIHTKPALQSGGLGMLFFFYIIILGIVWSVFLNLIRRHTTATLFAAMVSRSRSDRASWVDNMT